MGYGDQLMGSGLARGAQARGKRIALGDRARILWDNTSEAVFRGNPNIARPGSERDRDIEWVEFYKGHRVYNAHNRAANRWDWNLAFRPTPGELFFDPQEKRNSLRFGAGFVLVEPGVESWKSAAPNKDWGRANYQAVVDRLIADGHQVAQFTYERGTPVLAGARALRTLNFRDALAILSRAALYVGPEGGLHHGAAAVETAGVVLFGGFIPPSVTGYDTHTNLTGGAQACGSLSPCQHCKDAMKAITVEEVHAAATARL